MSTFYGTRFEAEQYSKELRRWRNAFYGLPADYMASNRWHSGKRNTNVDAAALFRSIDRSRKGKLTGVWA